MCSDDMLIQKSIYEPPELMVRSVSLMKCVLYIVTHLFGACLLLACLQAGLLMTNAVLILNRKRFLSKFGLDNLNDVHQSVDPPHPLKIQAVGLLQAVQYLKVPVIAANLLTIVFELILGGA
jgi:Yos1-like